LARFDNVEGTFTNQTSVGPQIVAFGVGRDSVENHARITFLARWIWMGDLQHLERIVTHRYAGRYP